MATNIRDHMYGTVFHAGARGGGGVEERPKRARPALYRDRGGETEAGEPWARPHTALTSAHVS